MTQNGTQPTLWLVRHGETTWNWLGRMQGHRNEPLLTPKGRAQAEAVAAALADRPIERVVSSDLRRAVETALPIATVFDVAVELDPRLRERGLGVMEGEFWEVLSPALSGIVGEEVVDVDARPPGGESVRELYERAASFVDDLACSSPAGDLVVVTHGGMVRVLDAVLGGFGPEGMAWRVVENGFRAPRPWPQPEMATFSVGSHPSGAGLPC